MIPWVVAALLLAAPPASASRRWAAAGFAAGLFHPATATAAAGMGALLLLARRRGRRPRRDGAGLLLLSDQVSLALRAGSTLEGALRASLGELDPRVRAEVAGVLRSARREGLGRALEAASGAGERLYRVGARAVRTGAPLASAVEALAAEVRHEEHARRLAAARRLPVRLLLPLALLILPGFVLLVVGPALLGSLARLEIGW